MQFRFVATEFQRSRSQNLSVPKVGVGLCRDHGRSQDFSLGVRPFTFPHLISPPFYRASAVAVSPVLAIVGKPSVCPSVTRWHWVKTTQARITKSSPTDSPMTLLFGVKNSSRNSKGVTPSEGVKWEWGRKNSQFSANNSPYLRNGAR